MTHVPIDYRVGDATAPQGDGHKIIAHVCNDIGGWGRGFVLALSKRWPEPEAAYREWFAGRAGNDFALGAVQFVTVSSEITVANIIGQRGVTAGPDGPPVRYDAIEAGLTRVGDEARANSASVHMPRLGCGLAGGSWDVVGAIVQRSLAARGVPTVVYDLE